jgi:hypothetical protein
MEETPENDKEYTGGEIGFGHISVRPDGSKTEKLEDRLKNLMLEMNPTKRHPAEFIFHYEKTLAQTEEGRQIYFLAVQHMHYQYHLFQLLQQVYDSNNVEAEEYRKDLEKYLPR